MERGPGDDRPLAAWPDLGEATPNLQATYRVDGAAALGRVLDDEKLATVCAALAPLLVEYGVTGPYATIVHDGWRRSPALAELIRYLGAIACEAVGVPELVLFHGHLLEKPPRGADMDWHQDFSFLPIDRSGGLTLWVALDDITVDNGCLYYLFGTQLLGERCPSWGLIGDDDVRATLPPLEVKPDEPGIAAPTSAGCAIVYDSLLLHRSPANRSDRSRRSWVLSFVVPDARWSPSHSPHPRSAVSPRVEGEALEDDLLRITRGDSASGPI